jgi:hypothetical protein
MQFTSCLHSRFFKRKYWKLYNAVDCLPSSTAVSLNGKGESSTMLFSAGEQSRFFKRKYCKLYNAG